MFETLAIIIIVYILVAIVYVVGRTTLFPGLGNGVTMFDYPFMALMVSLTVVLIGRCFPVTEQSTCPRYGSGDYRSERFQGSESFRGGEPDYCVRDCQLPQYEVRTPRMLPDREYVPGFGPAHYDQLGRVRDEPCGPEYRRQDEIQAAWRKQVVSPMHMSPEELGRNPREADLYFYGEGMDEVSDYATRESLKRSRSRRDAKLNAYDAGRDLFDIAHRDESYRDGYGHANGAPYDPTWWDNDRY